MRFLRIAYYWVRKALAPLDEKDGPSAGTWQGTVRSLCLSLVKLSLPGPFLEIGCGEGLFLKKFSLKNGTMSGVAGIDLSLDQLKRCAKRLEASGIRNVWLIQADATRLPFKDKTFAQCAALNLFMNLPGETEAHSVAEEACRVLKTGGRFFLDIRNSKNLFIRLKYRFVHWYDATIPASHLKAYAPDAFGGLLSACGLRITAQNPAGASLRTPPILLITAERISP